MQCAYGNDLHIYVQVAQGALLSLKKLRICQIILSRPWPSLSLHIIYWRTERSSLSTENPGSVFFSAFSIISIIMFFFFFFQKVKSQKVIVHLFFFFLSLSLVTSYNFERGKTRKQRSCCGKRCLYRFFSKNCMRV